jgi:hypothetical protein
MNAAGQAEVLGSGSRVLGDGAGVSGRQNLGRGVERRWGVPAGPDSWWIAAAVVLPGAFACPPGCPAPPVCANSDAVCAPLCARAPPPPAGALRVRHLCRPHAAR